MFICVKTCIKCNVTDIRKRRKENKMNAKKNALLVVGRVFAVTVLRMSTMLRKISLTFIRSQPISIRNTVKNNRFWPIQ